MQKIQKPNTSLIQRQKPWLWVAPLFLLAFVPFSIQQSGLDNPVAVGAFLNGNFPATTPSGALSWTAVEAYPNLTFIDPVMMHEIPGGQHFAVLGKTGYIWQIDLDSTATTKHTMLDMTSLVKPNEDGGLIGMAFHPDFSTVGAAHEGEIYVWYRWDYDPSSVEAYMRLSRFTVPSGDSVAPIASEEVLIQQFDRNVYHSGGGMFFGLDGFLYLGVGDEGGTNDVYNSAQHLDRSLFAGLLRIDVNNDPTKSHPIRRQPFTPVSPPSGWPNSYTQGYMIPNDNPFLATDSTMMEEYFALGLRNPHRIDQDPVTGNIWVGDVGQITAEEISIINKGDNLQWPYGEGFSTGPQSQPIPVLGNDQGPIFDYPHSVGQCIIGGVVYRGTKWASGMDGKYIYGDHSTRNVYSLTYDAATGTATSDFMLTIPNGNNGYGNKSGISAFFQSSAGDIYVMKLKAEDQDGGILYKLMATSSSGTPPALLSQTGAFSSLNTMTPSPGVIPFDLNVPFWSDGASKYRWLMVPNDGAHDTPAEQIIYSDTDNWQFPSGSVLIKHFEMAMDETNPAITKKLETRFTIMGSDGVTYGLTYRWRDDQTDAELLDTGGYDTLNIATANGPRGISWNFPSRQQCTNCHNDGTNGALGPISRQLNKDYTYPSTGNTANQLKTLAHLGMLSPLPDTTPTGLGNITALAPTNDLSYSLEDRARSYIDANCGSCHRPSYPVQAYFDARYPTALAGQGLVYGDPYTNLDYFDPKVVVPTDLEHSVLHKRLSTVHEDYSMPPLAKYKIDSAGVQTVEDWIQSLSPNYGTALQGQCISFPEIAPQKTSTPSLTLLSSTSSGLPVTYQLVSGPANLAGNVLTFTGTAGEVVVRAVQAGNATYEAAPTIERSFWVNPDAFANGTGLTGRYFDDITLTNQSFSQVDTTIDFQWGSATPNLSLGYEGFSISWEGEIEAPLAETYTFTTSTDDGVRLWVNNQLIIDQWQDQSVTNFTGTVSLPAQTKVPIRMEFYENTVFATARLYWSSPSIPRSIVPKIFLYPNSSVLPIEWQGFAVEEVGDQAQLYWEASSSDMGQEYIIERSENGEEFEFLKSVRPSSSSQTRFEAWDENPLSGTSYYRIKWQNIDGELSYSQIESAFFELFRYQVFPNPLGEGQPITVQLDFDEPQAVEIQVVDIRGRQLVKLRPSGWERRHDLTIATDGWRPGIYFVEILTNRKRITEKILLK